MSKKSYKKALNGLNHMFATPTKVDKSGTQIRYRLMSKADKIASILGKRD